MHDSLKGGEDFWIGWDFAISLGALARMSMNIPFSSLQTNEFNRMWMKYIEVVVNILMENAKFIRFNAQNCSSSFWSLAKLKESRGQ